MDKGKVLTLDLPSEIIRKIDDSPISVTKRGHRSRMFRFLLTKGLERYIDIDTKKLLGPIVLEKSISDQYPSRAGFAITEDISTTLEKLCEYYPFTKKSLAEFLICQVYQEQGWEKLEALEQNWERNDEGGS